MWPKHEGDYYTLRIKPMLDLDLETLIFEVTLDGAEYHPVDIVSIDGSEHPNPYYNLRWDVRAGAGLLRARDKNGAGIYALYRPQLCTEKHPQGRCPACYGLLKE